MRNSAWHTCERLLLIGIPETKRSSAFLAAARRVGIAVDTATYLDLIRGVVDKPVPGTIVRLDSPGESAATTRALLAAGIEPLEAHGGSGVSTVEIARLACDRGEILHPRQWYFGFREILRRLVRNWSEVRWSSHPAAIITTFDKLACLEQWQLGGIPVPERFDGVSTYAEIRHLVAARHARVIVKLRYGYSAVGAVALEWRDSLVRAITTTEVDSSKGASRLFVTKRPRRVTSEAEIAWLIDRLGQEEIVVERWLPKARWKGLPYDLRAVTIGGKVHHIVGRANASPFTNLNLGAVRMTRECVVQELGSSWGDFVQLCEQAAAALPTAEVLGIDILVRPCRRRFTMLEANAFGDYLPGMLYGGESTYEAILRRLGRAPEVLLA